MPRIRARIDRFKLASRSHVRARLMDDELIADAVARYADEQGTTRHAAWRAVDGYIREIVPFFNAVAYFQVGHRVAGLALNLLYKVSVEFEEPAAELRLPRDAVLVYVMNHRSNADYVLVSYALAGEVAISYAVGEWARAFPLESLFKAFGSYFIRRRYRDPLYHAVLERYVQLITREGVTQGIFVEGGLTRDGRLRAPKIGLLDYVLGIGRDPGFAARLHVVPVAINYDRVLEDRTLLRELESAPGAPRTPRLTQLREVAGYLLSNTGRLASRRFRRYGRAAVVVGAPIPLAGWFARHPGLFALDRPERLGHVQALCDELLLRVGALVPVTPVPLVCAALQSFDADFVRHDALLERIGEMRGVLGTLNARDLGADRSSAETFDRAWRMLGMRHMVARTGDGYLVLPRGRPLVSYYANSIAHLLGPFIAAVRSRDSLPIDALGV
ncbi:MAG: Glycerol-3-phosphate 1-O-acyltransferase [Gemmatimonadetes bacterium]|nr:Glycerol-3-phosphate 1-O-acyltransferase [Gemmatimonadota bacterium]